MGKLFLGFVLFFNLFSTKVFAIHCTNCWFEIYENILRKIKDRPSSKILLALDIDDTLVLPIYTMPLVNSDGEVIYRSRVKFILTEKRLPEILNNLQKYPQILVQLMELVST